MSLRTDTGAGDPIASFMLNLSQVAHDLVLRTLGQERTMEKVAALHEGAVAIADLAMDRLNEMLPADRPVECGKGCDHCCRGTIVVTDPATVLYLAHLMAEKAEPAERVMCLTALAGGAHRPCVLLGGDTCMAYRQRPVICRAYNAYDSDACAAGDLPDIRGDLSARAYPVPFGIAAAMATGIIEAFAEIGLAGAQVPLNAALRLAMTDPDLTARWLAGEDVFAPAREFAGSPVVEDGGPAG